MSFRQTLLLCALIKSRPAGEYFGVLYLDTPEFTAFVTYRQSKLMSRMNAFACEFLGIGRANFLNSRFEAEDL
ncbi:hypothetical protein SAMN04488527_1833, partial [Aliiroseovarius crassostreae]